MRYELVSIMQNGSTRRSDHATYVKAAKEMGRTDKAVFQLIFHYRSNEDVCPMVVGRTY